jgi:hypothetical protein
MRLHGLSQVPSISGKELNVRCQIDTKSRTIVLDDGRAMRMASGSASVPISRISFAGAYGWRLSAPNGPDVVREDLNQKDEGT